MCVCVSAWGYHFDAVFFLDVAKLVEVKGPRDVLSPKQTVWIDQLLACGMQVEVCHVQEK